MALEVSFLSLFKFWLMRGLWMCPCTTIHHVNVMLGERNSIALVDRSLRREVGLMVKDAATLAHLKKNTPLAIRGSMWLRPNRVTSTHIAATPIDGRVN
jgi:hypothetical protein